jgi:hypothetical protein
MTLDEAIKVYEEGVSKESEQVAEWLKELKRLKEAERVILWIARDGGGYPNTYLFTKKPKVNCDCFLPVDGDVAMETFEDLFPNLTFENSPQKVELRLIGK